MYGDKCARGELSPRARAFQESRRNGFAAAEAQKSWSNARFETEGRYIIFCACVKREYFNELYRGLLRVEMYLRKYKGRGVAEKRCVVILMLHGIAHFYVANDNNFIHCRMFHIRPCKYKVRIYRKIYLLVSCRIKLSRSRVIQLIY